MLPQSGKDAAARGLGLLAMAALVWLPAAAARAQDAPNLQRYSLDNGLRVWHQLRTDSDSVAVCLSVNVGSRNETELNNGISHLLEHMTFAGSERYRREELMELLRSRGGIQNAYTTEERTVYYARISAQHFELAVDWLSQIVFHATLPEERLAQERNVVIEEMGGKQGVLRACLEWMGLWGDTALELRRRLFPDSSLSLPIIGGEKALQAVSHQDLRSYYRTYYVPNNAVLVVVGNVSPERVRQACDEFLAPVPAGQRPASCRRPALRNGPAKPAIVRTPGPRKQGALLVGVRTCPAGHEDRWALWVLAELLQRNLMREARYARGLAYNISADNTFFTDSGYFDLFTQARRSNLKKLERVIDREIDRVRRGDIEPERLEEARQALCGQWDLAMENNSSRMGWLEQLARTYADDQPLPEFRERIRAVQAEDLVRVVNAYFTPDRTCVVRHVPAF